MSNVRNGYEEVETIENAGGASAVFTRRTGSPTHTVSFFKTYLRDGEKCKTTFFGKTSLQALKDLIPVAEKRLEELEAAAKDAAR